jgi:hypothetical protein
MLAVALVAGLWLSLPVIFAMADIGSGSSAPLRLAMEPTGPAMSVAGVAARGVVATGAAGAALWALMLVLQRSRRTRAAGADESLPHDAPARVSRP